MMKFGCAFKGVLLIDDEHKSYATSKQKYHHLERVLAVQ